MPIKEFEEPRKLELVSLIDVVFLLLIFFIVTTVLSQGKGITKAGRPGDPGSRLPDIDLVEIPSNQIPTFIAPEDRTIMILVKPLLEGEYSVFILTKRLWQLDAIEKLINEYHSYLQNPVDFTPAERSRISMQYGNHIIGERINLGDSNRLSNCVETLLGKINNSSVNYAINEPEIDFIMDSGIHYNIFFELLHAIDLSKHIITMINFHVLVSSQM